jgi:hypothetical protein
MGGVGSGVEMTKSVNNSSSFIYEKNIKFKLIAKIQNAIK